jgi:hypothetical protein
VYVAVVAKVGVKTSTAATAATATACSDSVESHCDGPSHGRYQQHDVVVPQHGPAPHPRHVVTDLNTIALGLAAHKDLRNNRHLAIVLGEREAHGAIFEHDVETAVHMLTPVR